MTVPLPRPPGTPRSVTALPPISNIPDLSLPFEHRDEQIAELLRLLNTHGQVLLHDVAGPPHGFGKTQVAIEYVRRFTRRYDVAWWFACQGETDDERLCALIDGQYRQLWERWSQQYGQAPEGRPDKRCLFVYDDVPDPDRIHEHFFPGRGHRLITSRSAGRTWGENHLELGGLNDAQSEALLMQHAWKLDSCQAASLASRLQGHPGLLLTWAEEVIRTDFDTCMRALDSVPETDPPTPPGGIPVLTDDLADEFCSPLSREDRRTLIQALVSSPVAHTRGSYDVWMDSVAFLAGSKPRLTDDSGVLQTRIVSVVNYALRQDTPKMMAALAEALRDFGDDNAETAIVRRLVDKAVKAWKGRQQQ